MKVTRGTHHFSSEDSFVQIGFVGVFIRENARRWVWSEGETGYGKGNTTQEMDYARGWEMNKWLLSPVIAGRQEVLVPKGSSASSPSAVPKCNLGTRPKSACLSHFRSSQGFVPALPRPRKEDATHEKQ